jgi:hypothetical protein
MKKLKKHIKAKRKKSLKKSDLAFTIDLLSSSMKSGLDVFSSFNSLKDSIPEPLAGEFQLMAQQLKIGMSRDEIFIHLANRLKVPAIHQMVQALLVGHNMGSNSTPLLDQIAQDIRLNRVSFKQDKSLFEMKTYKMPDSEPKNPAKRESEILKVDETFLHSHESLNFLKQAMLVGKNVLVFCHDPEIFSLFVEHFKGFMWIDLEKENIAQVLLSLSDRPSEQGKLLFIKATTIRSGGQRLKALLAFQEKMANAHSVKLLLDLLYLIPLQICVTTTKSQQSWISEISELRTILEDGFLLMEPLFITEVTGLNKDLQFVGYFKPTGFIPNLLEDIERNGGHVGREIFF